MIILVIQVCSNRVHTGNMLIREKRIAIIWKDRVIYIRIHWILLIIQMLSSIKKER